MKTCENCGKTHSPLKRYMWNTHTNKLNIDESLQGLLCEQCAKSLGAWQIIKQESIPDWNVYDDGRPPLTPEDIERLEREQKLEELREEMFDEPIMIGTPEEAERVAMSLTDEDIERIEREEEYSSLN